LFEFRDKMDRIGNIMLLIRGSKAQSSLRLLDGRHDANNLV